VSISSCSEKPTHTLLFQLMPSIIPLTYHFLLPSPSSLLAFPLSHGTNTNTPSPYVPLATADDAEELNDEDNGEFRSQGTEEEQELMLDDSDGKIIPTTFKKVSVTLSAYDKWRLVKPLLGRYMLPLCTFFLTSGISALDFLLCSFSFTLLQRAWLTNLELISVCVYLVRTPLDIRVRVCCGFGF